MVRGDKISVRYAEKDGDGDRVLESGETVRVYLDGLHMPIPKISGNYNPGYEANADGYSPVHLNYSVNGTAIHGPGKQYDFITAANYIDVVLPANSTSVTLADGYIGVGVLGYADFLTSANGHRYIPDEGCGMLYGYSSFHTRSILPQITIPINSVAGANNAPRVKADAMTTKTITQGQNFAINPETLFTDPDGDTLTYTVSVDGGAATTATSSYKYESTNVVDCGADADTAETISDPTEEATEPAEEETTKKTPAAVWIGVIVACVSAIAAILLNRKRLFGI